MKNFFANINPKIIDYTSSIRHKLDIIKLIINISTILKYDLFKNNYNKELSKEEISLTLCLDKMSRVFIIESNKMHSFQFPFTICQKNKNNLSIRYNNLDLDSKIFSFLKTIFNSFPEKYTENSIAKILEIYWDNIIDFNLIEEKEKLIQDLILYLLLFEPGYLRFDYDEKNQNQNHPLNHLDLYYESKNTFKLGIDKKLSSDDFFSLLDNNKCRSQINFTSNQKI